METEYILVGLLVLVLIFCIYTKNTCSETFCGNCGSLTKTDCENCANCGYCVNDVGVGSCVSGDPAGAYYNDRCTKWTHRDSKEKKCSGGINGYNCGYIYPYDERVKLHQQYAGSSHPQK